MTNALRDTAEAASCHKFENLARMASYSRLKVASNDPADERIAGCSLNVSSPCCCIHLEFN